LTLNFLDLHSSFGKAKHRLQDVLNVRAAGVAPAICLDRSNGVHADRCRNDDPNRLHDVDHTKRLRRARRGKASSEARRFGGSPPPQPVLWRARRPPGLSDAPRVTHQAGQQTGSKRLKFASLNHAESDREYPGKAHE
jgi:hypothetical protein